MEKEKDAIKCDMNGTRFNEKMHPLFFHDGLIGRGTK